MPSAFLTTLGHLEKFTDTLSFDYSPFHILILQLFYNHINSDYVKFLNCVCVCVLCIRILRGKCHTCTFYVQYCVCCICIYVYVCRCKHVQRPGEDIECSALLLHLILCRQVLLLHLDLVRQPTCLLVSAHVCWYVWKYKVDNRHLSWLHSALLRYWGRWSFAEPRACQFWLI